jgi:hypothetical protein
MALAAHRCTIVALKGPHHNCCELGLLQLLQQPLLPLSCLIRALLLLVGLHLLLPYQHQLLPLPLSCFLPLLVFPQPLLAQGCELALPSSTALLIGQPSFAPL